MKGIKFVAICVMILCALISTVSAEEFDHGEFYPMMTVVVEINEEEDCNIVTCLDQHGDLWAFYDEEREWDCGDLCNLLMWDSEGTPRNFKDDEIVETYWTGYTEDIEQWLYIMGWDK